MYMSYLIVDIVEKKPEKKGVEYREIDGSKTETVKALTVKFLDTIENTCRPPRPMFQGLSGRRHADMLAMLQAKTSVAKVALHFEVSEEYVQKESRKFKASQKDKEE
jgi:hypothetical protein